MCSCECILYKDVLILTHGADRKRSKKRAWMTYSIRLETKTLSRNLDTNDQAILLAIFLIIRSLFSANGVRAFDSGICVV